MPKALYKDWLTAESLTRIEGWAREGLNEEQIAHNMGVGYSTFRAWIEKYQAIQTALKKGKAPVDLAVENALYKSAIGFTKTLRKPAKVRLKDGSEKIEYVDEEFYYPPNTTAQIYWLKNRRRDRWKDKPEDIARDEKVNELLQSIYDLKKGNKS